MYKRQAQISAATDQLEAAIRGLVKKDVEVREGTDPAIAYFVDAGSYDPSQTAEGDLFGTLNSVTDQEYGQDSVTGYAWGYLDVYKRQTLDDACQRLTRMQERACRFDKTKGLPVLFNEFCTTWGNPSFESICRIVDIISDKDIDYFIIDAGWYADRDQGWENNMGDWDVSSELYPMGMQAAVDKIREAGLKPGIWFEPEIVGKDAQVSKKQDHLLKKHGKVIRAGNRICLLYTSRCV